MPGVGSAPESVASVSPADSPLGQSGSQPRLWPSCPLGCGLFSTFSRGRSVVCMCGSRALTRVLPVGLSVGQGELMALLLCRLPRKS